MTGCCCQHYLHIGMLLCTVLLSRKLTIYKMPCLLPTSLAQSDHPGPLVAGLPCGNTVSPPSSGVVLQDRDRSTIYSMCPEVFTLYMRYHSVQRGLLVPAAQIKPRCVYSY
jgi:hypothetical protein